MVIDFRVRAPFAAYKDSFFTPDTLEHLNSESMLRVDLPVSPSATQFSMPLLLQEADEAGIDKLVVPVRKATGGRNEDLEQLIALYPDRLIGLAGIDVQDVNAAIKETERFVVNGTCTGIVMEPGQDSTPWLVNSAWAFPLYDYCQEKHVPLVFTFGGIMTRSLRYYAPELIDDVAAAFPRLNIALMHGGWPYVSEVCQIALNRRNVYLAPDFYMLRSPGMADYAMAANYLLRERVIFSSAYPIMPLMGAKKGYEAQLREEVRPLVFGENAARFLRLSE